MKNILSVVETSLDRGRSNKLFGREYTGSCPWCGGRNRFHVYPDGGGYIPGLGHLGKFHCMDERQGRAGCGKKGDMIRYIELRENVSFVEACEKLDIDPQAVLMYRLNQKVQALESEGKTLIDACRQLRTFPGVIEDYRKNNIVPESFTTHHRSEKSLSETSEVWRTQALALVKYASSCLSSESLDYLHARPLTDHTIKTNLLGFYPQYKRVKAALWGYEYTAEDKHRKRPFVREIGIPRGIVIPWLDEHNQILCVRFRRLPGDETEESQRFYGIDEKTGEIGRYKVLFGSSSHLLYRGDLLSYGNVALFEGEFTALVAQQSCPDPSIVCVATGSTSWGRTGKNVRKLASCDSVLICFDADSNKAGDKASKHWLNELGNAKRWRPLWGDANDMALDGVNVGSWLGMGFENETLASCRRTASDELAVTFEKPLCATCVDAGLEVEALDMPADDGLMYCTEHHPARQDAHAQFLETVTRLATVFPGGCKVEDLHCSASEYIALRCAEIDAQNLRNLEAEKERDRARFRVARERKYAELHGQPEGKVSQFVARG